MNPPKKSWATPKIVELKSEEEAVRHAAERGDPEGFANVMRLFRAQKPLEQIKDKKVVSGRNR